MGRIDNYCPKWVDELPNRSDMQSGFLYICLEYMGTSHLCPCGCGTEVYIPIVFGDHSNENHKWKYTDVNGIVSLVPSITGAIATEDKFQ